MSFTEPAFLIFLALLYILFTLCANSRKSQVGLLTASSYFFYAWWDSRFLLLIFLSTFADFHIGKRLALCARQRSRRAWLCLSVVLNIGLLAYFKYAGFFVETFAALLQFVGFPYSPMAHQVILPLGISFYTFQTLSYTLDIYFDEIKPHKSFIEFMFFVSAFPQLVAGPIVRAKEFLPQLRVNLFQKSDSRGLGLILYGLAKKLLIADMIGVHIVNRVFENPMQYGCLDLVLASYGFAFQIFLDFSGYTDIAIGTGMLFGLKFPENFDRPYLSKTPKEFWERWHITLSRWIRDYIFQPMAMTGLRYTPKMLLPVVLFTFFLSGLWHGASWTYVIWGVLHGVYLVVYQLGWFRWIKNSRLQVFVFFNLVAFSHIFFRSESLTKVALYLQALFVGSGHSTVLDIKTFVLLGMAVVTHNYLEAKRKQAIECQWNVPWVVYPVVGYLMFICLGIFQKLGISHDAFVYFQF